MNRRVTTAIINPHNYSGAWVIVRVNGIRISNFVTAIEWR